MKPASTPVLLVVAASKIHDVPAVIDSIRRHSDFNTFYIVCPPNAVSDAERTLLSDSYNLLVVDEELVIPGLNAAVVHANIPRSVPGWQSRKLGCWYYQQFLKMGFSDFVPDSDYYLIWDTDTLLTRRISFYEHERVLLTASHEYHRDYFKTIKKLLPGTAIPDRSHISQHALVRTADMAALLAELSSHGLPWWQYVLSSMTGKSPQQFSEYETYAAYCLSRWPERYQSLRRRWFRSGTAYFGTNWHSANISALANLYDYIAFEGWDTGPRRRRRSRVRVVKDRIAAWSDRNFGWTWFPK
jgi:hypothetical protein